MQKESLEFFPVQTDPPARKNICKGSSFFLGTHSFFFVTSVESVAAPSTERSCDLNSESQSEQSTENSSTHKEDSLNPTGMSSYFFLSCWFNSFLEGKLLDDEERQVLGDSISKGFQQIEETLLLISKWAALRIKRQKNRLVLNAFKKNIESREK